MKNMTGYPVPNPDWRRSEAQAKRERQIRDIKDLANIPYMGKNE